MIAISFLKKPIFAKGYPMIISVEYYQFWPSNSGK